MGILDFLSKVVDAGERYVERQSNDYYSGYDSGSSRASSMTDDELRSELNRAKNNCGAGMRNAGKTRALIDEYKERNK